MRVDSNQVEYIAALARLEIEKSDLDLFVTQFNDVLSYVDVLNKLDTDDVIPTAHVGDYGNVFREDVVKPSLTQQEVLANAPEKQDGGYLVPRVMQGGGA